MCARYCLRFTASELRQLFQWDSLLEWYKEFNLAPTREVLVLREVENGLQPTIMTWGLKPFWLQPGRPGFINAKLETASEKPAFRDAVRTRRCIFLADGFFEWATLESGRKQPYLFSVCNEPVFGLAGIYEDPPRQASGGIPSAAILTTSPNELVGQIHDRMPVILRRDCFEEWLNPDQDASAFLAPFPETEMSSVPVNPALGNPKNQGDEVTDEWADAPSLVSRLG
jgi:putative SOS response-associated peptidase YedK